MIVDGRVVPVARTWYWDLLNPNFGKMYERASLSADGHTLTLDMAGSDGAGSYVAQWRIRTNGRHSRKMLDPERYFSGRS
ncbi:hypothetical protein OP10G_3459 [Fimbriimonas ginsengisoli Gsoil 348]|uniref:Uncharacterized protein n=1 Tax=Fimbriimonas ginsengisoli Gsoil 348 TaxID=661478 RepID=A0A068NTY2_FIMGI|nr:hypothetical protein OP10G_3459 [Fimbriimonas ginsengisoli Gsoil 348]